MSLDTTLSAPTVDIASAETPLACLFRLGARNGVKVGRRPVLDYVLNPITRVIDESLREP